MDNNLTPDDLIELSDDKVLSAIVNESDPNKLREVASLFNLNQAKKDILRVTKYNQLVDDVLNQMLLRVKNKGDEFSNQDLIAYLNTASTNVEKAKKAIDIVDHAPSVQINQVNIDAKPALSRESRERVLAAVNAFLNKSNESIIDIETSQGDEIEYNKLNEEE